MVDKTKDGPPPVSPANGEGPGKPRREPPTIDLAPGEVVEETAPLGSHRHAPATKPPEASAASSSSVPGVAAKPAAPTATPVTGKPSVGNSSAPSLEKPAAAPETAKTAASAAPASAVPGKESTKDLGKDSGKDLGKEPGKDKAAPSGAKAEPPAAGKSPEPAVAPKVAAESAPRARGGAGAVVLAGLFGGIVGAAATAGLAWWYLLPASNASDQVAALEENVDRRLTQAIAASARRADLDALVQRVTGLGGEVKATGDRLGALAQRVDALPANGPGTQATPAAPGVDPQALAALSARVDQLAGLQASVAQLSGLQASVSQLAGLANRVDSLETAVKAVDPAAGREARDAAAKADALSGRLTALEGAPSDPRIALLARAIVANRLLAAIDAGRPYAADLAALKRAVGSGTDLGSLDPDATMGLPTNAALAREFSTLADRLVVEAPPTDGSFVDRLAASASRVVRIRPVDGGEATGSLGTVGRIEAALAKGDLKGALEAWRTLPEPARRLSQAWAGRLEARVAADAKVQTVLTEAVDALATRPQGARNP